MSCAFSIIIPLAPGETLWRELLPRLNFTDADEVIIASTDSAPPDWQPAAAVRWLQCSAGGRAAQMNAAADSARHDFLWFVHADSRPAADAADTLKQAVKKNTNAVHYFALRFYDGGSKMRINEFGVYLRCRLFANPFGDQALCIGKTLFKQLGGYDESAAYGEDHLLVLRARRSGAKIIPVQSTIATSARRYITHGWWNTVLLYQRLWWRQWKQQ